MESGPFVRVAVLVCSVLFAGCGESAGASTDDAGADTLETDAGADTQSDSTALDSGPTDSGAVDTALTDTGLVDTGLVDTGLVDTGLVDTGLVDTGIVDTGIVDTGLVDTGLVDTGALDTGTVDTGPKDTGLVDTGPIDTGLVDTGPKDTGPVDTGPGDPCSPLPTGLTTWTKSDSASVGTPDTYFFNVTPGDPFCATITGSGGSWSLNVSNGTSSGIYCSGSSSCSIWVPKAQLTLLVTAVTTDIGSYTLTVRYRPRP